MKIEIRNRFTGNVIFSFECDTLKECVIEAVKSGADLTGANLTGANLTGADLTRADLRRANLTGANLTGANLTRANLTSANLTRADLTSANLRRADLTSANLTRADLSDADLRRADLTDADLDLSCFPLQCSSLTIKTTKRLRVQLAFHFLSLIKNGVEVTDQEKKIYFDLMEYANEFHRTDVKKLEAL